MIKAVFIADTHEQAGYWAALHGFKGPEWIYVRAEHNWNDEIYGFIKPEYPAYVVGFDTYPKLVNALRGRGFEVYDAEALDTDAT